jgi:hypothetical protein
MKPASVLFVIFLLVSLLSCSGGLNDLDRGGVKGKVMSTKEYQCRPTYENSKWIAGTDCSEGFRVMEYDEKGFYIHAFSINNLGDTASLSTAKRVDGDVVEEIYYSRVYSTPKHSRLMMVSRTVMDRVSSDQVNFEVWQEEQLRYEGATYYDSKGRIEKQVQVVNNHEVTIHHVYDKNLLVEMYQEESDGSRSATQLYDYSDFDEKGNWTLRLVYNGEEMIKPEFIITRTLEYY